MTHAGTPVTVSSDQARQWAIRELSKSQYHRKDQPPSRSPTPSLSPSPTPSTAVPQPPPPAPSANHALAVVSIILAALLVVALVVLVLRRVGKPRTDKKVKDEKADGRQAGSGRAPQEALFGAALHRHQAQAAAAAGDWAAAVRERFRAVVATLDERALLPERADRTAGEAARDAGALLPAHAAVLAAAARTFDEVQYGEYVGTPEAYSMISGVDELVCMQQPGTLQLPTAIAPTVPGGAR